MRKAGFRLVAKRVFDVHEEKRLVTDGEFDSDVLQED